MFMRSFVFVVALAGFTAVRALAQVAIIPSNPAISPASPALVPSSPALSPVSVNPNLVVTNSTLVSLSSLLLSLQSNLEQTLPVLEMFNDNFDFVSLGDNGVAATREQNPAGNFGGNFATNFAGNFGVNVATPTGPSLFNTVANTVAPRLNPAAAGLPGGLANIPVTRETLRALLILQSDIQHMLPVINALNAGTASYPGSFTNLFGIVPGTP
jgi:hypothetical protein